MKILVAVDGSPDSNEAVSAVAHMATRLPAEIKVVTVVNPPDVPIDSSADLWVPQLMQQQEEIAKATLQRAAETLAGNGTVTTESMAGHVSHSILEAADDFGADLVVTGAIGHSPVSRIVLGSVSDDVATHAKQSVMVFRQGDLFADADQPVRVTIAYDGSESADKAIADFAEFAWAPDAIINVVSVAVKLEMFGQDLMPAAIEEAAKRRADALRLAEAAAERLKAAGCVTVAATMVESDHTGEGVLNAAADHDSDLIIVGDKGHGFVARLFMGSTSRYVLRHAKQSVLIAR